MVVQDKKLLLAYYVYCGGPRALGCGVVLAAIRLALSGCLSIGSPCHTSVAYKVNDVATVVHSHGNEHGFLFSLLSSPWIRPYPDAILTPASFHPSYQDESYLDPRIVVVTIDHSTCTGLCCLRYKYSSTDGRIIASFSEFESLDWSAAHTKYSVEI